MKLIRPVKLIREVMLQDVETHETVSDRLKMIFIDLRAMNHKEIENYDTDQEKWIYSIKNLENMENKPKGYPLLEDIFNASELCNPLKKRLSATMIPASVLRMRNTPGNGKEMNRC